MAGEVTPGIYPGIPAEQYHSGPGTSRSQLELVRQSPAVYWDRVLNPDKPEEKETDAMRFGSLFHSATLEPDTLADFYRVAPQVDRRTKDGKAAWADFERECEENGLTVVSQDDLDMARAMATAVRNHPRASRMLAGGAPEQTIYWTDSETGLLCRARPDYLGEQAQLCIPDLKSTNSAHPSAFARSVVNFGYHRQEAFYAGGVEAVTGDALPMVFLAVEKARPFQVALYTLPEDFVEKGRQQIRAALRRLADCKKKDEWPGYPEVITELTMPGWAYMED
ncbi:MAG: PD-(D/E)XK nuclease-like domain-containing protein [Gemmatimonadota bacterium]|nr:PD-(D/E)XK nuclease-like domain-containing protein [Nitrospirota bacterium]MDH5643775.1 PD-(D/E)XK nuclease-like domain-containing protein [Gemmatimonadota bacterium]